MAKRSYVGIVKNYDGDEANYVDCIDLGLHDIEDLDDEYANLKADRIKNLVLYILSCIGLGALMYKILDFWANAVTDSLRMQDIDYIRSVNKDFEEGTGIFEKIENTEIHEYSDED